MALQLPSEDREWNMRHLRRRIEFQALNCSYPCFDRRLCPNAMALRDNIHISRSNVHVRTELRPHAGAGIELQAASRDSGIRVVPLSYREPHIATNLDACFVYHRRCSRSQFFKRSSTDKIALSGSSSNVSTNIKIPRTVIGKARQQWGR